MEGDPNAVALEPTGNRTYVDLVRERYENISIKQMGSGRKDAYEAWQNNQQNKNTIRQQAVFLEILATHLTTNAFRPEWNTISKTWKTDIKACADVPALSTLLLQLENSLKEEALTKEWKSLQTPWRDALNHKIKR